MGGGKFETLGEMDHVRLRGKQKESEIGAEGEVEFGEGVGMKLVGEFLVEIEEEIAAAERGGGVRIWGGVVVVADEGDGELAEDAVDDFDIDEHAGLGVDVAAEGGGEGEEGREVSEGGTAGEVIGGAGSGVVELVGETEA